MIDAKLTDIEKGHAELYAKLSEIQQKLEAPKGQYNEFGNYHYRSAEDILNAVKPLLGDCVVTVGDEIVLIGERYYVKASAVFTNGKHGIITTAFAREPLTKKGMDESQITGSSSSYARKYALNGLFAIDDTKDADTMDNRPKPAHAAPVVTKTPLPPASGLFCSLHNMKMFQTPRMKNPAHLDEKRGWCNGDGFDDEKVITPETPTKQPAAQKVADDIPF